MIQVKPFDSQDPEVRSNLDHIMKAAPVKNLTEDEVLTTLRLLQLQSLMRVPNRNNYYRDKVVVHRHDPRLELCDDNDRFLAMLVDCELRDVLLFSGRCRSLFGGTVYHWRNIGRKCPITSVASAISECGSGYYGRGWEVAPHIKRLCKWIIENSTNPEIRKLKI